LGHSEQTKRERWEEMIEMVDYKMVDG